MSNTKEFIDIRECGMSANETTLHPSHNSKSKPIQVLVRSSTRSLGSPRTASYKGFHKK